MRSIKRIMTCVLCVLIMASMMISVFAAGGSFDSAGGSLGQFGGSSSGSSGSSSNPKYTIEIETEGEGGTVDPGEDVKVSFGSDVTIEFTADDGYYVVDVLVDGESVEADGSYTFENVRERHTLTVIFGKKEVEDDGGPADPDVTGVSKWLNTTDHIKYLSGYPDGTFLPDGNMKRGEAAQMFYNLLLDKNVAITAGFSDIDSGDWYMDAVNTLASLGIITGYSDGTFRAEESVTRAEFVTMAMRFAVLPEGGENIFSDVLSTDWFVNSVLGAVKYGWVGGYPDGTFKPYNTITRAEVTSIMNNMLDRQADEEYVDANLSDLVQFSDVTKLHWAYYEVAEATNGHDYYKDGGAEKWGTASLALH